MYPLTIPLPPDSPSNPTPQSHQKKGHFSKNSMWLQEMNQTFPGPPGGLVMFSLGLCRLQTFILASRPTSYGLLCIPIGGGLGESLFIEFPYTKDVRKQQRWKPPPVSTAQSTFQDSPSPNQPSSGLGCFSPAQAWWLHGAAANLGETSSHTAITGN